MLQVRSRGLPDDHAGPVRIIDIQGVDANMCCGTHVSNLSHLQVKSPDCTIHTEHTVGFAWRITFEVVSRVQRNVLTNPVFTSINWIYYIQ